MNRFLRSITNRASREDPERLGAVLDRFWSQICSEARENLKALPEENRAPRALRDQPREDASPSRKWLPKA